MLEGGSGAGREKPEKLGSVGRGGGGGDTFYLIICPAIYE